MVRLTVTSSIQAAWHIAKDAGSALDPSLLAAAAEDIEAIKGPLQDPEAASIGNPIPHDIVVRLSKTLRKAYPDNENYRISNLLKGSNVYVDPPKAKSEPTPEFKALMARLRREREAISYERMTTQKEELYHGTIGVVDRETEDEVTYTDVNRQLTLVLNVVISIVFCAVAIWMASWHWAVPKRLFASMGGSIVVGVAEVVIYAGYLRRIKEAKMEERKKKEVRQISPLFRIDKKKAA